jgi:hypothetical protein
MPTAPVSMHTPVVDLTALASVKPDARYPATLTHVSSVLHNKEFAQVLSIQDPFGMLRCIRDHGRGRGTPGSPSGEEKDILTRMCKET